MTYRLPREIIGDLILRKRGKRRAVVFPEGWQEGRFAPYGDFRGVKEGSFNTFLRPRTSFLPPGAVNL